MKLLCCEGNSFYDRGLPEGARALEQVAAVKLYLGGPVHSVTS